MAFRTGYLPVFSVKFESGPVMVEGCDLPYIRIVAAQAVGHPVLVELPVVIILVAHRTVRRHVAEPLHHRSGRIFREMTVTAGKRCMGAGYFKTGD